MELIGFTTLVLFLSGPVTTATDGAATSGTKDGNARTVNFPGGRVAIETRKGVDHLVVTDGKGRVRSESWCDSARFDDYSSLFANLKKAITRGDRVTVLKLVGYPLRVNSTKMRLLRDAKSLARSYDEVFTKGVLEKIRNSEPAALFCRNGAAMLGDGVVWATGSTTSLAISTVNQ